MENSEFELYQEQRELENDSRINKVELEQQKRHYAELLKGEMGKDMMSVLNGEQFVTIPRRQQIWFKIKCFFKNIFAKI